MEQHSNDAQLVARKTKNIFIVANQLCHLTYVLKHYLFIIYFEVILIDFCFFFTLVLDFFVFINVTLPSFLLLFSKKKQNLYKIKLLLFTVMTYQWSPRRSAILNLCESYVHSRINIEFRNIEKLR